MLPAPWASELVKGTGFSMADWLETQMKFSNRIVCATVFKL